MNNLSVIQKFNNNRIERQKFQQSPMIMPANLILQRDIVSFGWSFHKIGIDAFKNLKPMSEEFIAKLEFGSPEGVVDFIADLASKSARLQKTFVLFPDEKGNSHFAKLIKHRPELAGKFLDFVAGLDGKTQKEFALMRNDEGHTHFDIALQNDRPDVAMDFLGFVGSLNNSIQKKFALSRTTQNFENQYNVALRLGHYDAAEGFLDFVKRTDGTTPSKFFLLQDIKGKFPFEAAIKSGEPKVLKSVVDFTSEAVSKKYLLDKLLDELAVDNPFSDDAIERVAVRKLFDEKALESLIPSGFWKLPDSTAARAQA